MSVSVIGLWSGFTVRVIVMSVAPSYRHVPSKLLKRTNAATFATATFDDTDVAEITSSTSNNK